MIIGFSFMYLVLCLVVIFGVVLLIYSISHLGGGNMAQKRGDPAWKQLELQGGNRVPARLASQLPARFDPDFIQHKMAELQHSPNLIDAYFKSLEMRFRAKHEMRVLEKIRDYNELIASGISSEAKIYQARAELEQAKYQWGQENDISYQQLKHEDARLALEESIAQRKHNIAQLGGGSARSVSGQERLSPEEYRQRNMNRMDIKAEDMRALDSWRKERLETLDESLRQELAMVAAKPWPEEEKKKQSFQIKARYAAQRDEILKARP